ncbi:broad-complex core protein isoforms 1/2/3/4/5-like isoform X1 [Bactrocera tryoni]|uniref:broad-complex core protein isoforms 1/2/3/4/5-like isoform X1 n=2 Tax=Bactrocera tryoni TaxID=59916 RepID=UPI001A95EDF1|nr:broad-complex core protein isoforms 1/2/3/4/5-like isoform X1 [Bactrocera tryoni]
MDDEFKLCWKNFQDNIASGFQNLYDRGDLVDVTLACDGKLLHAHKIVLAICSPYFQEIFITNPCKHPIIILKDVTFNIMCELLEFMYQGVVNVKHTELQSFMKIGQLLQIKGLATNASSTAANTTTDKSASQTHNADEASNACVDADNNSSGIAAKTSLNRAVSGNDDANGSDGLSSVKVSNPISVKSHSPASSPSPMSFAESTANANQQNFKSSPESNLPLHPNYHAASSLKRHADVNNEALSIYSRKQFRRSIASADHNTDHSDSADADAESDYFLPSLPHLATNSSAAAAAAAFRGTFNPAAFGFDYNLYKNSSAGGASGVGGACGGNTPGGGSSGPEYPNDLHIPSDYSKNFANHVDIPPNSSNVVMLSSTSLLHGSCVFNRNNTVATQQGMKTYWLCKSYRISMCRARCITHQGRVISATGVHNHPPHMRGSGAGSGLGNNGGGNSNATGSGNGVGFPIDVNAQQSSSVATSNTSAINLNSINMAGVLLPGGSNSAANVSTTTGVRLHHTTGSGAIGTAMYQQHNSMHNSPAQQLQLHHQQQQLQHQQHQLHAVGGSSSPPPMSAGLMGNTHLHGHSTPSATSLLMSHHSAPDNGSMAGNVHHHQHHQHHTIGGSGNGGVGSAGGSQNLHSNSVIQNILHSANASNAMHHHHHSQLPHMSHLSHHQHHQQHEPHLEITPLMQSPPLPPPPPLHLQSPSNQSNQSQHGSGGANSLSSPITTTPASVPSGSALKSPGQTNLSDEAICASETQSHSAHLSEQHQHMLSHGTTLSPSEINSNTAVSSHSTDGATESQHQAHVIDSITISPGEGHSFKMEDM